MRLKDIDKDGMVRAYLDERLPMHSIGDRIGVGAPTISRWLRGFGVKTRTIGEARIGSHHSEETKRKMSAKQVGKIVSQETRDKLSASNRGRGNWWWGKHLALEHRKKISEAQKGDRAHGWRGGVSLLRGTEKFKYAQGTWRKQVFERDDYTCQVCGQYGWSLVAHHILPYSDFPEHRDDIENGITFCVDCHYQAKMPITRYLAQDQAST